MAINADWLRIIDERIDQKNERLTAVGTVVEWTSTSAMVLFDGSALAVPVKTLRGVVAAVNHRVGLMKFGTDWTIVGSFSPPPPQDQQLFDTVGANTWNKPAGARRVLVELQAAGGGGGGSLTGIAGEHSKGGGGGGGAYCRKWFWADSLPDSVPLTVGAAGSRGNGANGGTGGTTSFGSPVLLSVAGGEGGSAGARSSASWGALGGAGGSTSGGTETPDLLISGDSGGLGVGGGGIGSGGEGGGSFLGGGGRGTVVAGNTSSSDGNNGLKYGGGGGGAQSNGTASAAMGGLGGTGCAIITSYF